MANVVNVRVSTVAISRFILFLAALSLGLSSCATAQPFATPPLLDAQETYGLVLLIDGAKGDVLYDVAHNGLAGERNVIPNIRKYFMDNGAWVRQATTVFPTITGAGVPSVLTGCFPGRTNIPSLYFFDRTTQQYAILYVFDEAFQWNKWLSPDVKTIWEYFEAEDDSLAFGPALWRGADFHTSVAWNFKYAPGQFRAGLSTARRGLRRTLVGGLPARLTVAYNGWFDHKEHELGAKNPAMLPEYEALDALVGEAIGEFLAMVEERTQAGVKVNYYVTLVSDHGHKDISQTMPIDSYMETNYNVANVKKDFTRLFGQAITGSLPTDLARFDCLIAAGEGHGLFYFPVNRDFRTRPSLQSLRNFSFRGRQIDIPGQAVQAPAVGFMLGRDERTGNVHVYRRVDRDTPGDRAPDEATIERKVNEGRTMYRYEVVAGKDPLGFDANDKTKALVGPEFHDQRDWQLATLDTNYPDAIVQLYQVFDARDRAPDFFLSAHEGISIGDSVAAGTGSKHGGLTKDESWATLAFFGSGIPKVEVNTARIVDMVPTMLTLMGKDYDADRIDGEALPEIVSHVRAGRALATGTPAQADPNLAELRRHVERLKDTPGDQVLAWARTFQALAQRPIAQPEEVRKLRERAFGEIYARTDAAARKLVKGERSPEFLIRCRSDLPRVPRATPAQPASPAVVAGLSRDIANATYLKVFELLGDHFDRLSIQNAQPFNAEKGNAVREAGERATAQIDRLLQTLTQLRQAGYDVPAPKLSFSRMRNGLNLRYEGLDGQSLSQSSLQALNDYVTSEGRRAGEGNLLNPLNLGGRLLFRESIARFQLDVGRKLQATVNAPPAGRDPAPVNPVALAQGLPPGRVRTLLEQLADYGQSVALRPAASVAPR